MINFLFLNLIYIHTKSKTFCIFLHWDLKNFIAFVIRINNSFKNETSYPLLNAYLSLPTGEEVVPAKKTKTIVSTAQISETRQTRIEKVFFYTVSFQAFQIIASPTSSLLNMGFVFIFYRRLKPTLMPDQLQQLRWS